KGSIQKRTTKKGDVSYLVRVELPPDPTTGKRKQRAEAFPTKKAAESAMAQWLAELDRGIAVDAANLTLAAYLARWLDTLEGVEPATRERYEALSRLHVLPALGSRPLAKLTPLEVQQ